MGKDAIYLSRHQWKKWRKGGIRRAETGDIIWLFDGTESVQGCMHPSSDLIHRVRGGCAAVQHSRGDMAWSRSRHTARNWERESFAGGFGLAVARGSLCLTCLPAYLPLTVDSPIKAGYCFLRVEAQTWLTLNRPPLLPGAEQHRSTKLHLKSSETTASWQ